MWVDFLTCIPCPANTIYSATLSTCVPCYGTVVSGTGCKACDSSQYYNNDTKSCADCAGTVSADRFSCTLSPSNPSSVNVGAVIGDSVGGFFGLLLLVLPALCLCSCCFIFILFAIIIIIIVIVVIIIIVVLLLCAVLGTVFGLVVVKPKRRAGAVVLEEYLQLPENAVVPNFGANYRELALGDLKMAKVLGRGSSGQVYSGSWRSVRVAIKTIAMSFATDDALAEVRHEMEVMTQLGNHPSIIPFIGAVTTQPDVIYIVTKLCEYGSLYAYMVADRKHVSPAQMSLIYEASASGLAFLHAENIVHRDVAARNYLLAAPFHVYLSDFGMSRLLVSTDAEQSTKASIGPVRWMAPESCFQAKYSKASDCYMYGSFLYEIVFQRVPFAHVTNLLDVADYIERNERPPMHENVEHATPLIRDIIKHCWKKTPSRRYTMEKIIELFSTISLASPSVDSADKYSLPSVQSSLPEYGQF